MIPDKIRHKVISELVRIHGDFSSEHIKRCVETVASRWLEADGPEVDFQDFCIKCYISDPTEKVQLFNKIQNKIETILGLSHEIEWSNKWSLMMQTGPLEPVDTLLAEMDPLTHLSDDFYRSKISHLILLNFPLLSLDDKNTLSNSDSDRMLWAQCRLAELCQFRIPFEVKANESTAINYAYQFLSYLIFDLNRIIYEDAPLSSTPSKVDMHWGVRDQIVFLYQHNTELAKQKLLYQIWEMATKEEVPEDYYKVDSSWEPIKNILFEKGAPSQVKTYHQGRYKAFLGLFKAKKEEDFFIPELPNYINRNFELGRELKESTVRKLFTDFLTNPLLQDCAHHLKSILHRELHAFDILFNQFGVTQSQLPKNYDEVVKEKYPTLQDFQKSIPDILEKFGFKAKLAHEISKQIDVVTCRAGGFSSFPKMRGGKFLLALPTDDGKMNYTSFLTAMHELGHCVEGYLSLEKSDYYLLGEVPCAAFSEAFAYLFDSRSLEILGIDETGVKRKQSKILNLFWSCFLNCGIALVDIDCWHWMYNNPDCTEEELRAAVINISHQIWNQFFSPIFGEKNSAILAGYNVMIANPLYLPEYALAIFIQAQIENYLTGKTLGVEMPRMCQIGKVSPDQWMIAAVGEPISYHPLLKLAESALKR